MEQALIEHRQKYERLATKIGVNSILRSLPKGYDIVKAYNEDHNLNNVPLSEWDNCGHWIYARGGLSYAEVVCLLKHVAITRVCKQETDFEGTGT